jgi:hypothetical protein
MADEVRKARLRREFEQQFLPDYDASNMPSADKRAAYALEHVAYHISGIHQSLDRIAAALETVIAGRQATNDNAS